MDFRKQLKRVANKVLPGLTKRYLSRTRIYTYGDLTVKVPPGVFHPGLYFSTRILLEFLEDQQLRGQKFLELGAGSGLISLRAARAGAQVTASDISQAAIAAITENAQQNQLALNIIHSDLFEAIPPQQFDWVVVNPPYFQGTPANEEEFAWYCGPDFEYFDGLFGALPPYMHSETFVIMILSEDCELERIREIGTLHGVEMELIRMKKVMGEKNFLYRLSPVTGPTKKPVK